MIAKAQCTALIVCALLLGAACGGAQKAALPPPCPACPDLATPDPISGVWVDSETQTYLVLGAVGGKVVSIFVIDDDGEVEPVSDVSWDGTTLRFTTYIPSTAFTLVNVLQLQDPETLTGRHEGSHVGSGDVWKRWHAP